MLERVPGKSETESGRLPTKSVYSKAALMDHLQEEWNNIDKDLCIKLVESMSPRTYKRSKTKGGHFL